MIAIFRTSARRMMFALAGGAAEIVDMWAGRGVGGSPERRRFWAGTKTRNSSTIGVRRVRRNLGRLRCIWGVRGSFGAEAKPATFEWRFWVFLAGMPYCAKPSPQGFAQHVRSAG